MSNINPETVSLLETHFVFTEHILSQITGKEAMRKNNYFISVQNAHGIKGLWEEAMDLTLEFERRFFGTRWDEDLDFIEEADKFFFEYLRSEEENDPIDESIKSKIEDGNGVLQADPMLTIWKYELTAEINMIDMPIGAKILTVQTQNDKPCIWALVNPQNEEKSRHFGMFGTGHPVDSEMGLEYIGTFQLHAGKLVFHLFEISNYR